MSTCKSCGAGIIWAKTVKGKNMPLDVLAVTPDVPGTWVIIAAKLPIMARPATVDDPPELARWMPHWATCEHADSHRKRGQR